MQYLTGISGFATSSLFSKGALVCEDSAYTAVQSGDGLAKTILGLSEDYSDLPLIKNDCDVLLVEDDHDIRESLQQVLEFSGYTVLTAENGKEALDLLAKITAPRAILLDLMMPVMNGWQFMKALEASDKANIPVIVVTAFTDKANGTIARSIVKKPIDLDALINAVKTYC